MFQLFISTEGIDSATGKIDSPIKTIQEAQKRVRAIASGEVQVVFRAGNYVIDKTIIFGIKDGGGDGKKVTYTSYNDERVVFTSGVKVKNWKKTKEYWTAPLPVGINKVLTLFCDDEPIKRCRSPKFVPTKAHPYSRADSQNIQFYEDRELLRIVDFPKGMIKNGENLSDLELRFMPVPWTMNLRGIESVDEEKSLAMLSTEATAPLWAKNAGVFLENDIRFLEKGRWCVNTIKKEIYYYPKIDEEPTNIFVPTLCELFRIEGIIHYNEKTDIPVKNLHFVGLEFKHTARYVEPKDYKGSGIQHDWELFDASTACLRFRGVENCSIDTCYFHSISGTAIRCDLHAQQVRIENTMIDNIGNMGILLCGYGPGTKDVNHHNTIKNTIITRCGQEIWHGHAIFIWQSGNNIIEHNKIHDTARKAIGICGVRITILKHPEHTFDEAVKSIRWKDIYTTKIDSDDEFEVYLPYLHSRDNIVRKNEVYKVLERIGDGSAINISGAGSGNIVSENYVHHISSYGASGAMRVDDWQCETLFTKNIIYKCNCTGIIRKNYNHIVNNIIIDVASVKGAIRFASYPDEKAHYGSKVVNNIFYVTDANAKFFGQGYLVSPEATYPMHCQIEKNIYFCAQEDTQKSAKEHITTYSEHSSAIIDPLFKDIKACNFELCDNSPAFTMGFEKIDMSDIGILKSYPKKLKVFEYYKNDDAIYDREKNPDHKSYDWW